MTIVSLLLAWSFDRSIAAQPPPGGQVTGSPATVQADAIKCWWRTSGNAVRVGEPFSVVLTCAVLDADSATVVPDQSQLDPSVVQLPPFEVIGGTPAIDFRSARRRFFQYRYDLRLISEDMFGREVKLPALSINYRIQSRAESIQGRDRQYILPAESIRVLSLVPADATDIRDRSVETFRDIEALRFRASALRVIAVGLFGLGAGMFLFAIIRVSRRAPDQPRATARVVSDRAILRGAGRELANVRLDREANGWNRELAARALAAARVVATFALSCRVSQTLSASGDKAQSGQLVVSDGWLRPKTALISTGITSESFVQALSQSVPSANGRVARLGSLQTALVSLAAIAYGRDETLDLTHLDDSVSVALDVLQRLKRENAWIRRKFRAISQSASQAGGLVWRR
jgi:hypothetical protein